MKMKTVNCLLALGAMSIVSKTVWAWEAEVLKEKLQGQCEFGEEGEADFDYEIDAATEYARLQDAHGVDETTKVSHVENTFGRGKAGLSELEKSIDKAKVGYKKPKKAKVTDAVKPAKAKEPVSKSESTEDPLA